MAAYLLLVFLSAAFYTLGCCASQLFPSAPKLKTLQLAHSKSKDKSPTCASANPPIPGKPQNVSTNNTEVKKAVLIATYSFNNQSNDAFFFRASAIDCAQRQVVKGVKYILKVEISRTVCKKRQADVDLANCAFQSRHMWQQTLLCHFEVWDIPWENIMKTTYSFCLPTNLTNVLVSQ